jgi:hypothetical protein
MAEDDRTFRTSTPAANRGQMQGLGVGQKEIDAQLSPSRDERATDPQRTEPFEQGLEPPKGDDLGREFSDRGAADPSYGPGDGAQPRGEVRAADVRPGTEDRSFAEPSADLDDRDAAGLADAGDLGAGTPSNVDVHDVGQEDRPEEDWGEAADEGALHSANHTRRAIKTEAERGQGAKTRRANKDIVSRRG